MLLWSNSPSLQRGEFRRPDIIILMAFLHVVLLASIAVVTFKSLSIDLTFPTITSMKRNCLQQKSRFFSSVMGKQPHPKTYFIRPVTIQWYLFYHHGLVICGVSHSLPVLIPFWLTTQANMSFPNILLDKSLSQFLKGQNGYGSHNAMHCGDSVSRSLKPPTALHELVWNVRGGNSMVSCS